MPPFLVKWLLKLGVLLLAAGAGFVLFELAKSAFEREVEADAALQARARASAERQVRALLLTVGFKEVVFVPWPMSARAG